MMKTADFLIIGGGIVGLTVARELKRRYRDCAVVVLEKERECGLHASGRNSGVLHAGFYYTDNSLKARFARDGNRELAEFCREHGVKVNSCGKLVVARDDREQVVLQELLRRGKVQGVDVSLISEAETNEIEPLARTHGQALYSPTTSTVDPKEVVDALARRAVSEGITISTATRYLSHSADLICTSRGAFSAGYVVNAAGLYADKIAHGYGCGRRYKLIPFRGVYLLCKGLEGLRTNIYPVPDLNYPFLGVHYTVSVHGDVKVGPTAMPALWREQYSGLDNFSAHEFLATVLAEAGLLLHSDFNFKKIALGELKKRSRRHLLSKAAYMLHATVNHRATCWGEPGVRAQLYDIENRTLVMDFRVEGDGKSMHILNAVSPAFTASMPFARHVCDRIDNLLSAA